MGSDILVALGRAAADGLTIFGQNLTRPAPEAQRLMRSAGRRHEPGEMIRARHRLIPQARQTHSVVGLRSPGDTWGYRVGLNDRGLAAGLTTRPTRLPACRDGLLGTELIALALDRAESARQAIDLLVDLLERHGQSLADGVADGAGGNSLVVADRQEAFLLEVAGRSHWAVQEFREVRVVSGLCQVRQDWDRISRGVSELAIGDGCWPSDGSKVDFTRAVGADPTLDPASLRRWGRATVGLEARNGRIDLPYCRRLLADSVDGLCRRSSGSEALATSASFLSRVAGEDGLPLAWCCLGSPHLGLYFPVSPLIELPELFGEAGHRGVWHMLHRLEVRSRAEPEDAPPIRAALAGLQSRFEHQAEEFLREAREFQRRGEDEALSRLGYSLLGNAVERCEEVCHSLLDGAMPARMAAGVR